MKNTLFGYFKKGYTSKHYRQWYCDLMNTIDFRYWFCDCYYAIPYGLVIMADCKKHD